MTKRSRQAFWFGLCLLLSSVLACAAQPTTLTQAQAVPASWTEYAPPQAGWQNVTLPHQWQQNWPKHQGAVWYRLTFQNQIDSGNKAMMLPYLNMAGSIYLNGQLIQQDVQLLEPLSRSWNAPKLWQLPTALLQPGANTLIIRTVGYAQHQAGIGALAYGPSEPITALYWRELTLRRYVPLVGLALHLNLLAVFGSIYFFQKRERAYGWFALMCLAWALLASLFYVASPWLGLPTQLTTQAASMLLMLYTTAFIGFTLTLLHSPAKRLMPKITALLLIALTSLWLAPHALFDALFLFWLLLAFVGCTATVVYFLRRARQQLSTGYRPLAVAMMLCLIGYSHDLLMHLGLTPTARYLSPWTANILVIVVAYVLIKRFSNNVNHLAQLNQSLIQKVRLAQYNLAQRLNQQHDLSKSHACLEERLNLVRDLHDGLGATLVASLATSDSHETQENPYRLGILNSLQDDMRLIIETATNDYHGEFYLADQIATFRHRMTESLNRCQIKAEWQIEGLSGLILSSRHNLDILRFMQEALTNVMKHSHAHTVSIHIAAEPTTLAITISDDGSGYSTSAPASQSGQGLSSMRMRAKRLNAELSISSGTYGTRVSLDIPR
ncbi:MAG: hypothetical protein KA498_10435 [Neisseriaceae bacterium]|nr:hypothetical protein [Neisseriaceae bacterium]